jgi:hypothetical protein
MGELGGGCESDAVCQDGLECGQLVEVPGIFSLSSCSECASDDACSDGLCSPSVDIAAMTGHRECVPPASLLFGSVCDHLTSGDQACASGHCAPADLAGLIEVGVCGDCSVDTDCDEGMQCVAPQLTLSGAIGSYCA